MKVLWFSNCVLSKQQSSGSGSWLFAMKDLIYDDVELINITSARVLDIKLHEGNGIKEYLVPSFWSTQKGVPSLEHIKKIENIIQEESPDIIHIWGVEEYWALLFSRGFIKFDKVLLEIQGVISACVDVMYGGLSPKECKQLFSIKSALLSKHRLSYIYRKFLKKSLYEEEIIRSFRFIAVQSQWTQNQVSAICNEKVEFFHSLRPIRQDFYKGEKWIKRETKRPVLFTSISYYVPFKGLHVLIKALNILCQQDSTIVLRIAGPNLADRPFYNLSDYERFILKEIKKYKLENNIHFCGKLNASQLVQEIQNADVVVNPSLVESYSAAAAESLYLGAPTVLAYAGAMVDFSELMPVALYYNPLDCRSLVARIKTLLWDGDIRQNLTANAVEVTTIKCSPERVKERQLEIYKSIVNCD